MKIDDQILFYHEEDGDFEFTNYYERDIVVDGQVWKSVEHYYQAEKTLDPTYKQRIHDAAIPDDAKMLGNAPECVIRPDWNTWKLMAMRKALFAKFTQHEDLRKQLLATGDCQLHENSWRDAYWGLGPNKDGLSMLGKMLMALREELRYFDSNGFWS